jgi:hypothetical protein
MRLFIALFLALTLSACGSGLGTPTESSVNRGESGAIKPNQGATFVNTCLEGGGPAPTTGNITINNTNNCNKDNPVVTTEAGQINE